MPYQPDIHPIPADAPGTVALRLDALVTVQDGRLRLRRHADDLFRQLVNEAVPGFFGEPVISPDAPGYTAEVFPRARVLWPVRDQERHDPRVRFVPADPEAVDLFARAASTLPDSVLADANAETVPLPPVIPSAAGAAAG